MKRCSALMLILCMLASALPVFAATSVKNWDFDEASYTFEGTMNLPSDGNAVVFEASDEKLQKKIEKIFSKENLSKLNMSAEIKFKDEVYNASVPWAGEKFNELGSGISFWTTTIFPKNFKINDKTFTEIIDTMEPKLTGWDKLDGEYITTPNFPGDGASMKYKHNIVRLANYLMGRGIDGNAIKIPATITIMASSTPSAPSKDNTPEDTAPTQETDAVLSENITTVPQGEVTINGPWEWSTAVLGPMEEARDSLWISTAKAKDFEGEASVKYDPFITAFGNVRISVYLLHWNVNQTTDVLYRVHHNGKVDEFHIDMTKITKSGWKTLGTFDFEGTGDEYVEVVCTETGDDIFNTRASTVAFEILINNSQEAWSALYVTPNKLETINKEIRARLSNFSDMTEHWASYDVEYMASRGMIQGVGEGIFSPDAQITRAEYITILDRAMGYELVTGESYPDVTQDAWYATYVATAKANGLLEGLPADDGFKPEQPITREEMALFTYNAIKATNKNDEWVKSLPNDFTKFTDTAEISPWAKDAMKYLVQSGIIKGMTETSAAPHGNATRAQGAVILKRFMQLFVWAGPPTDEEWVMTFNDEFNGTALDENVWIMQNDTGNGAILSGRWTDNCVVEDGALNLEVRKENRGVKEWTSGCAWVNPEVFRQSYGYWEARFKYAAGPGINNAFWVSTTWVYQLSDGKLPDFEIDINEGHYPNEICTNFHSEGSGERVSHSESYKAAYDLSADYHTYALKWDEDFLYYYLDGEIVHTKINDGAAIPVVPIVSNAVLNWGGRPNENTDGTAQTFDYVRVWQRKADVNNPSRTLFNKSLEGTLSGMTE